MKEMPWDSAKVAFSIYFEDIDKLWDDLEKVNLPEGWRFVESIANAAFQMVIFEVQGPITEQDGLKVKKLLEEITKP